MTLILTLSNVERLGNGQPTRMELDRHGLTIGRSPHMDWSLPDPDHYISSNHCEIRYRDGAYVLCDTSTNGTFLKGASERLAGPHTLADGQVLQLGGYEIAVRLQDGAASAAGAAQAHTASPDGTSGAAFTWGAPAAPPPAPPSAWDEAPARSGGGSPGWAAPPAPSPVSAGWASAPSAPPDPPAPVSGGWGAPAPASEPGSSAWGAPAAPPPGPPAPSWGEPAASPSAHAVWDAPKPATQDASDWSDPAGGEARPAAADIWASLSASNSVDWGRGFGAAPPAARTPAPEWGAQAWAAPAPLADAAPPQAAPPSHPSPPSALAALAATAGWDAFVAGSGVPAAQVRATPPDALGTAGRLLSRLVGGMVVLLEARARAKAQMGAQGTLLEVGGNNPLKFARTPEQALAQLLNAPERGFMDAERAVEDAFRDLQAHQMATLAAMQGALKATIARFSPAAIRTRAERRGVLAKILPVARDQAMWQAYEREFEGVAQGSDEAFMDVFSGEFRRAYEEAAARLKSQPGG